MLDWQRWLSVKRLAMNPTILVEMGAGHPEPTLGLIVIIFCPGPLALEQ